MTGRADRAKELLENDLFKRAFEDVKNALVKSFFETDAEDTEKLIQLRIYAHLLDGVKANLVQAVEDGMLEDFNANQPKVM